MFKELDTHLKSIDGEISKMQTAAEHINEAKSAALKAIETTNNLQTSFSEHLKKVTKSVEGILKPHEELIKETDRLAKTIAKVNFPERLDKQEKKIKLLTILLFISIGLTMTSIILPLII